MTTLKKLANRVNRILTGGDYKRDNAWDLREIADTIRDVTHTLMRGEWYAAKQLGNHEVPSHYIATYEPVAVKSLERKGIVQCYIDLPANPIQLPMEMGVQRIVPLVEDVDEQVAMIPVTKGFKDIYGSLRSGMLEGLWGYEVHRGKVFFTEKNGLNLIDYDIEEVLVELAVVSPQDIGMDDEYPAPPDMIDNIMVKTLERFGMAEQFAQQALVTNTPNQQD